jgi:hypothetical protein
MKPFTRIAALLLALSALLLGVPGRGVKAWGPSGHRIVAMVAMEHVSEQTRQKVKAILGEETLADVANWADDVRDDRPDTAQWHFVNLPHNNNAVFSRTRDCHATDDGGPGCVITAIEKFSAVLRNSSSSADDRAEALKFIVHFVGDLHQPLHVSFADDRGDNNIKVTFFGRDSKLHRVWDSGIIGRASLSDTDFAEELESELEEWSASEFGVTGATQAQKVANIKAGTPDEWARQSFRLAVRNAYDTVPRNGSARLGQPYYEANWKVVDIQLIRAGLRLARILDEALA